MLNFEPPRTPPGSLRGRPARGISRFEYSRLPPRLPLATLTPTLGTPLLCFPSGARAEASCGQQARLWLLGFGTVSKGRRVSRPLPLPLLPRPESGIHGERSLRPGHSSPEGQGPASPGLFQNVALGLGQGDPGPSQLTLNAAGEFFRECPGGLTRWLGTGCSEGGHLLATELECSPLL